MSDQDLIIVDSLNYIKGKIENFIYKGIDMNYFVQQDLLNQLIVFYSAIHLKMLVQNLINKMKIDLMMNSN